ncbi:MAG: MFS transporter [Candidatus Velthaea sp.]
MLTRTTTLILAVAAGIAVANIYYIQPVLELIARDLHAGAREAGFISLLIQLGYALGILFCVPLGDVLERRTLCVVMFACTTVALVAMATARTVTVLALAGFATGATTIVAQILMPFAADLASPETRGRVVGAVQTGLIVGIVYSRAAGGLIGAHFGWRTVFWYAAAVAALSTLALWRVLPLRAAHAVLPYPALLRSVLALMRDQPLLRASMALGFCSLGAFSAFWTTVAFHMHDLGYSSDIVGALGAMALLGAALSIPFGSLIDRRGTLFTATLAIAALAGSFLIFLLGGRSAIALFVGMIGFPIGTQLNQISNQSRIFALDPSARSRLNTAYMFGTFSGGAAGAAAGAAAFEAGGWTALCGMCLGLIAIAALIVGWLRLRPNVVPSRRTSDVPAAGS